MLYYPLINPPPAVLHHAILYWDEIATIVPETDYERYLHRPLRQVDDAGLYRPVTFSSHRTMIRDLFSGRPRDLGSDGNAYDKPAHTAEVLRELRRSVPLDDLLPPRTVTDRDNSLLWPMKFSTALVDALVDDGLARWHRAPEYRRLVVSPALQTCLLGMQAELIAAQANVGMDEVRDRGRVRNLIPHTDRTEVWRFVHGADREDGMSDRYPSRSNRTDALLLEVGRLLPSPGSNASTDAVIAFRNRYNDERLRLIVALHRLIREIHRQPARSEGGSDVDALADLLLGMRLELDQAQRDMDKAGRAVGMEWVRRSVSVMIAVGGAAAAYASQDWEWLLGVLAGIGVNVATNRTHEGWRDNQFSYLHRVDKALTSGQ
ncbi:hypothetical protein AB0K16_59960 [Nonomuraea jabiensis]|uniref:hypothetical protein n=1 Tax=Nonomuraea jabiensis TaxID=882448 RepID=UPI00342B93D5